MNKYYIVLLFSNIILALSLIYAFQFEITSFITTHINPLLFELQGTRNPNIILISVDALRADHVRSYGYPRNTTPNIDKIANEGVLFYNAISSLAVTLYSHKSMMTGKYPPKRGVLISEILHDKDYVTGAFVSGYTLSAQNPWVDIYEGFEVYDSNFSGFERNPYQTNKLAIKWIEENHNRSFFAFIHYYAPHGKYVPPPPYNKMFVDDGFIIIPGFVNDTGWRLYGNYTDFISSYNTKRADINYFISQYDGEIRYNDAVIGELIEKLDELEILDNTIVIITSDHGESMGEHDYFFDHGDVLYDELVKVPLIIRYPSKVPMNKIIYNQVRLIDIMPTVLDILNVPLNFSVDGRSLVPLIHDREGESDPFAYIISDWCKPSAWKKSRCTPKTHLHGIITNKWKFIHTPGSYNELYDLENDPNELNNVADKYPEVTDIMLNLVMDMRKSGGKFEQDINLLDETSKEKLRSLGYLY